MDDLIDASYLEVLDLFECVQLDFLLALHQKSIIVEKLQRADSEGKAISFLGIDAELKDYGGLHGHLCKHTPVQLLSDDLVVVGEDEPALDGREDAIADHELYGNVHHEGYHFH